MSPPTRPSRRATWIFLIIGLLVLLLECGTLPPCGGAECRSGACSLCEGVRIVFAAR